MKNICLLLLLCLLGNTTAFTQNLLQIGEPLIPDQGYDLMLTQDGGFVTCGHRNNVAVVLRSDCAGSLVAQIEKQYTPGPGRFYDAIQLSDGNIVAVGSVAIATPTDTLERVLVLKTTSGLTEIAATHFTILGKSARAKSVALTQNGDLLIFGEVTGSGVDFNDLFVQRVAPNSLQPLGDPVIYSNGVDIADEIIRTFDGNYLLAGSNFFGNIFDPNALIVNRLQAIKINESGSVLWEYAYQDSFPAQFGLALCGGVEQNPASGNFMLAGTTYGGSPTMHQDAIFILIGNNGNLLDTALFQAPMRQGIFGMTTYPDVPGLYLAVGDSDNPLFGTPNVLVAQAYELNNQIFQTVIGNDVATPISLNDVIEIGQSRLAIIGTIPDNPTVLSSKNIVVATPEIGDIEILYQNCALAASFNAIAPTYQWYLNDTPIIGATAGVYFPSQSGVYRVQITDNIGCSGFSDTLTVTLAAAGFDTETTNLTAIFTNTSVGATTWFWDFGDGQTSMLANPEHTYAAGGVYSVTLIASNSCSADTIMQTFGLVGSDEPLWMTDFRLFPNPNDGIFSVKVTGTPQPDLTFVLSDMTGRVIGRRTEGFQSGNLERSLDFGDLRQGIYTLQIQAQDKIRFVKVAVTK